MYLGTGSLELVAAGGIVWNGNDTSLTRPSPGNLSVNTTSINGLGGVTAGTYTANLGIFATGTTITVTATNSPTVLPGTVGASGLLRLRDQNNGGVAIFMLDPNVASQVFGSSNITGCTTAGQVTYSGSGWRVALSAGSIPRVISWTLYD